MSATKQAKGASRRKFSTSAKDTPARKPRDLKLTEKHQGQISGGRRNFTG